MLTKITTVVSLVATWLKDKRAVTDTVLIAAVVVLVYALVDPFREITLGDDAFHLRSVAHLARTGELRLDPAVAASLVGQVLWASWFAHVFGFSFSVAILSLLPLTIAGAVALNRSLVLAGCEERDARLLALAFVASPLVVRLAPTFMSDVSFVSLSAIAICCFQRREHGRAELWLALCGLCVGVAYSVRQMGLVLLAAVLIAIVYDGSTRLAVRARHAGILLASFSLVAVPYQIWLRAFGNLTWMQRVTDEQGLLGHVVSLSFPLHLLADLWRYGFFLFALLTPLTIPLVRQSTVSRAPVAWVVSVVLTLAGWVLHVATGGDTWTTFWVGGVMGTMGLDLLASRWVLLSVPLGIAGCVGGAAIWRALRLRAEPGQRGLTIVSVAFAVGSLVVSSARTDYRFDRYVLPTLLCAFLLIGAAGLGQLARTRWFRSLTALAALAAIIAVRFNLNVAEVQWREAGRLVQQGVAANDIRANMSWETWALADACAEQARGYAPEARVLNCWDGEKNTLYKIKLYELVGRPRSVVAPEYHLDKTELISSFGIPLGRVGVFKRS